MNDNFFQNIADNNDNIFELHHGNCIGVDTEIAIMAMEYGAKIICHPPSKSDLEGDFISDEYREPYSYFKRNRNIVDECSNLIVVPFQNSHQTIGGTWYTYDYAIKKKIPIIVFYPDGRISHE